MDENEIGDLITDFGEDIDVGMENFYIVRILRIDYTTGKPESNTFFEDYSEAIRESGLDIHGGSCVVRMVLVERVVMILPNPVPHEGNDCERCEATDKDKDAFGATLRERFSDAMSGDNSPELTSRLESAIEQAADAWMSCKVTQTTDGNAA